MDERCTLMVCPGCGKEYTDLLALKDDPDRLCEPCFDKWDGMTLEQIMGLPDVPDVPQPTNSKLKWT